MNAVTRVIPDPQPNVETEAFWAAAKEGRLLVGHCGCCQRFHYYPRKHCPHCFAQATWVEAAGKGTVYSFSIMRHPKTPYVIAYVMLEEGVAMLTNIVDCDPESVRIGDSVRVVFKASEGGFAVPMFTPFTSSS